MEIISCVGFRSKKYNGTFSSAVLPLLNKVQTSFPLSLKMRNSRPLLRRPAFHKNIRVRPSAVCSVRGVLSAAGTLYDALTHNVWISLLAVLCIASPFLSYTAFSYISSFAKPLMLESIPAEEIEILNKAMSDFALDRVNEFDDDGNILNADGVALTPPEAIFQQPVTYQTYTVKSGDTLLGITRRFGLSNISTLIAVNDISNVRQLRSGQKLRIPSADGLLYTVKSGDSLNAISVRYHVPLEDLLDVNDLQSVVLTAGSVLFIPGAKLSSDIIRSAMGELFMYPLAGSWRLTSSFGSRADPFTGVHSFHTGIDMAMPTGTLVHSAMSGTVATVGYTNIYGNYVIINHGNGYQTLYAHLSKTLVKTGQRVEQTTNIGRVGSTGYSTGPHLHFTVYKNGKLIDPMTVLRK